MGGKRIERMVKAGDGVKRGWIKQPKQLDLSKVLADDNIRHVLAYGGGRSGKTFLLCYAIFLRALKAPGSRHLILRLRFNHIKQSLWYDTIPKVLKICFPGLEVSRNKQDWFYTLPNGSEVWLGGLDDKERCEKILGKEYVTIYFNECSQLSFSAISLAYTRLAQKVDGMKGKFYYDENPPTKRHWTYKLWFEGIHPKDGTKLKNPERYKAVQMNPKDNMANIQEGYLDVLEGMSMRDRRRFEEGEFLDDADGALFKYDDIAAARVIKAPANLELIHVGVDPAMSANVNSADTGIIVCGRAIIDGEAHFYVLEDRTIKASPHKWAKEVIKAYNNNKANWVVGEVNQGGDLVETNVRAVDPYVPFKQVRATKGKAIRAEPVGNVCEKGKLHMVGELRDLEDEMTTWNPESGEVSPNRIDAMVWAITSMMKGNKEACVW